MKDFLKLIYLLSFIIYLSQTKCDGLNQNECEDLSPECEYVELFPPLCDGTDCALSTDLSVCQTSNGYSKSGGTPESCPDNPNCFISGELCYRAATNDECGLGELACNTITATNCALNSSSNGCITTDGCSAKQNAVPISCSGTDCNLNTELNECSHQMDVN